MKLSEKLNAKTIGKIVLKLGLTGVIAYISLYVPILIKL